MALLHTNWITDFLDLISDFDVITLFRHESPDGDAYGSSLGLKHFLISKYPDKQILMVSSQQGSHHHFFEDSDVVSDELIKESCAIVCDTANAPRVDDQRFLSAKMIIKIDHHPPRDQYGHFNFVDDSQSSCCQMIAQIALSQSEILFERVARYLYAGMLTDTVSFSINSVTSETLEIASKLLRSNLDVASIHNDLFKLSDNVFDYITYLRQAAIETEQGLIYCFIEPDILDKYSISVNQAKEVVNTFKEKDSAQIWMLLIKEESGLYRTTIRSKSVVINEIATNFGGGGHKLAAATRDLTYQQALELIDALNQTLKLNYNG